MQFFLLPKRKRVTFGTPFIHIGVQSTVVAYIRGLFSWLFDGCEVMERLGRHRASLAKPYLVMAAQKSALDCLRLQFLRIPLFRSIRARSMEVTNQLRHLSTGSPIIRVRDDSRFWSTRRRFISWARERSCGASSRCTFAGYYEMTWSNRLCERRVCQRWAIENNVERE